jgi:predicted Zn-dependent peptidase
MVIGVYGKLEPDELISLVDEHFGQLKKSRSKNARTKPSKYIAETREITKSINQSHAVIGNRTISIHHKQKNAMSLLSNYLGGPGMSSRLNLELREKKGICYSIDANYIGMSDTGLFTIYMGTDIGKMEKCIALVEKELKILREKKLSTLSLNLAKKKFIGQISLAEENHLSVIIALSRSVLDYGKADSLSQIYKKIESVTSENLQDLANEVFNVNQISKLIYLPE